MKARTPRAYLGRTLDRRRFLERDVRFGTVVAAASARAEFWVLLPGSSIPVFVGSTQGRATYRPGATVPLIQESGLPGLTIAGLPPPGRRGAAAFQLAHPSPSSVDVYGIISATPDVLEVGVDDQAVTVTGYGFNEDPVDTFRPVVFDVATGGWADDPDATVHDVVWVSASTVTMEVDVAAGRPTAGHLTLQPWRAWETIV